MVNLKNAIPGHGVIRYVMKTYSSIPYLVLITAGQNSMHSSIPSGHDGGPGGNVSEIYNAQNLQLSSQTNKENVLIKLLFLNPLVAEENTHLPNLMYKQKDFSPNI